MNSASLSSSQPTATARRPVLAYTLISSYFVAWICVIWHPFTWFLAGLMFLATLIAYLNERLAKCPNWNTFQEAILVVWFLLPYALLVVYFYFNILRPVWH